MRKYISNFISRDEIKKWKSKDRVLITAQTGSGKTQWIKDVLYEDAKENNKRILLLSNRNTLRNQNISDLIDSKLDVITVMNYQLIENWILERGRCIEDIFRLYDYICFDECHYWFSDSSFNSNTDVLINMIKSPLVGKIYIYITATPQVLKMYHSKFEHIYPSYKDKESLFDYSYIESIYFYTKRETVESIISSLPLDEQIIYFGSAINAYEISMKMPDAAFVCSDDNKGFSRRSSKHTLNDIEETGKFRERLLCSTTVLDTGISIISNKVKHIFIDILDPITFIQCLGRRRVSDPDDKITLYIRNHLGGEIYNVVKSLNKKMKYVSDLLKLGKDAFQDKYARENFEGIIRNNFEINNAKYYHAKFLQAVLGKMISNKDEKDRYKRYIAKTLKFPLDKIQSAEGMFEKKGLEDVLAFFMDKEMFRDEQEKFKRVFFGNIFSPKRSINYRKRGLHSINSILEEDNLPFMVVARTCWNSKNRGKTYWKVIAVKPTPMLEN